MIEPNPNRPDGGGYVKVIMENGVTLVTRNYRIIGSE